jgi:hypothetical protein
MNITFEESLKSYMPVYYHFLDGFINKNVSFTSEKTYRFILSNSSVFLNTKINLLKYLIVNKKINLDFNGNKYEIDLEKDIRTNRILSDVANLFHYCICQISADKHATSLLFFIKEKDLFVASFNSGEGCLD